MRLIFLTMLALGLSASQVAGQPIREERIQFAAGTTGTTFQGRIEGSEIIDYLLSASAGQQMQVTFTPDNPSAYFNLLPGSDPTALFNGSVEGNVYDGTLPASGEYRLRVYLMRSAARRNEAANYSMHISIDDVASEGPSSEFADGLSGGPDWWQVARVSDGDLLNVRSRPGTDNEIVGKLANGDVVANLGCEMAGESKWCQIGDADRNAIGWASGRYLREGSPPSRNEAKGMVPCAMAPSQPTGSCTFRVSRGSGGTASVWVTMPAGDERYFDFREGNLVGTDPGLSHSQERRGDLNVILLGNGERYEIPDAVIYGG
ncbi:SH3 domain-containing protein [Ruegeria arenilitoris]|uniref:SH3 domain-containing protein n=1 Tax=Ruegeria arenilitoris TaxID=1173585 RepID=UPI00147AFF11|nr:SH3 domain-containing protein [Ruegeria arenilitoris]